LEQVVALRLPDPAEATRQYRRGAIMGLTVAEAFMLLAFVLLMLMLLWRFEDQKELEAAKGFIELPPAQRQAVLETSAMLQESGLDPANPVVQEKLGGLVAMGDANPPREVLASLAQASEPERRKLEDLIRSDVWRDAQQESAAEQIAGQLEAAAASQEAVAKALRRELGPLVARHGGTIETDGSLVFPDTVLFEVGRADITPQLRTFLDSICLPWIRTVEGSGASVSDLRIEGHASSEWTQGTLPQQAYLNNLALSQQRAHAVLSTCLELIPGPEGDWARERATAVGYSSSHPIVAGGVEDKEKSRRVVFRVDFDLKGVIDGIQDVVDEAGRLDGKGEVFAPQVTGP
jgi:outer membrane protein OmpA-like peptidoglycan-associated protein